MANALVALALGKESAVAREKTSTRGVRVLKLASAPSAAPIQMAGPLVALVRGEESAATRAKKSTRGMRVLKLAEVRRCLFA